MLKILVKTDKFAKRMIKNGERAKRTALFRMGSATRNELRNVVRKRKGTSKADGENPPNDHGTYRKTALFKVEANNRGMIAGFSDFKARGTDGRRVKRLTLGNNFAQDTLEFGGDVTQLKTYKDRSRRPETETFTIKSRPHVFIARERLFTGTTKNAIYFRRQWQYLIDRGYLK